jgi:hypothetical protein
MSYKSVLGQQMVKTLDYYYIGKSTAETLETVATFELDGMYLFTCIFAIEGTSGVEDSDMRAGDVRLLEYPFVEIFTRTLTGIAETGTFQVKQKYRDACDYAIHLKLTKLT